MIRLFFKSLLSFIKRDLKLSLIILFGMIICNITILYFTNSYFYELHKSVERETKQNQVVFCIEKDLFDDIRINSLLSKYDFVDNWVYNTTILPEDMNISIFACGNNNIITSSQLLVGDISLKDNNHFICSEKFNQSFFSKYGIMITLGFKLALNDVELICSGIVTSNDFDLIISENTIDKLKVSNINLIYYFNRNSSQLNVEELNSVIIDEFKPINVTRQERVYKYSFVDFIKSFSNFVIFLIIAIFNYIYIYSYIICNRSKIYSVLKIEGLTTKMLVLFFILEIFLICTLSLLLSTLIYLPFIINNINIITFLTQIGYTYVFMMSINLILFLLYIIPKLIKQPIVLYREAEKL